MESQPVAQTELSSKPVTPRRAAIPRSETTRPRGVSPFFVVFLVLLALGIGAGIGVLVMRQRHRARQIVASINGVNITDEAFYRRLELASGPAVIRQMVGEELQAQYAKKLNVFPTDAEVEARYAEASKQAGFAQNLAKTGQTIEEFKRSLRLGMAQEAVLNRGVQVTDADIHKFYTLNTDPKNPKARYYTPEITQIAVIVTTTEADVKAAQTALNQGVSWQDAAKKYSKDRSKDSGGLMPPIPRGRTRTSQVPGMEDAIFGLKIGEQLGPRKFAGAWWLIRCLDKKPAVTRPFEEVKEECKTGAMLTKGLPANAPKTQTDFADFQKKATVQAFWERYKNAVNPN